MIEVIITESDIIRAIKNPNHNPIQISLSRKFNVSNDDIDVLNDRIYVWIDENEDHEVYNIVNISEFNYFMEKWNDFVEEVEEDFLEEPLNLKIELA